LVSDLIGTTEPQDIIGCVATTNNQIIGCIFFSRFVVPSDEVAFILSPVAISTSLQGSGLGQKLIYYGLTQLKSNNVNLVFTYGDPNYYSKTGFGQISESIVKAPFELSQPEGWLAQKLDGNHIKEMHGVTKCVQALSDQKYW
jgi:putative acetyltransferase